MCLSSVRRASSQHNSVLLGDIRGGPVTAVKMQRTEHSLVSEKGSSSTSSGAAGKRSNLKEGDPSGGFGIT